MIQEDGQSNPQAGLNLILTVLYTVQTLTLLRVAQDQTRFGDQMIWRLTSGTPLRWVRVTVGEVVHTQ